MTDRHDVSRAQCDLIAFRPHDVLVLHKILRLARRRVDPTVIQPAHDPAPLVIGPSEAPEYLALMDIDTAHLTAALVAGETLAANITTHHPVTGAGLTRWIHVVGTLREKLSETGLWQGSDKQNRPLSVHTSSPYRVSTLCGTEPTGVEDHAAGPRAARRKGRSTAEAINATVPWISVRELLGSESTAPGDRPPFGNWFLIYHRREDSIWSEMSLPTGFDTATGQFTGWKVRVILDTWTPDTATTRPIDIGGQDVDFRVVEA